MALTPSFTDLPHDVSILAQIEGLKAAVDWWRRGIHEGVENNLNSWQIGTLSYFYKKKIIDKMVELNAIRWAYAEGWKCWSTVGHSNPDWSWGCWLFGARGSLGIQEDGGSSIASALTSTSMLTIIANPNCGKSFQIFHSAGTISNVHKDFVFPVMMLLMLITSWFCQCHWLSLNWPYRFQMCVRCSLRQHEYAPV